MALETFAVHALSYSPRLLKLPRLLAAPDFPCTQLRQFRFHVCLDRESASAATAAAATWTAEMDALQRARPEMCTTLVRRQLTRTEYSCDHVWLFENVPGCGAPA